MFIGLLVGSTVGFFVLSAIFAGLFLYQSSNIKRAFHVSAFNINIVVMIFPFHDYTVISTATILIDGEETDSYGCKFFGNFAIAVAKAENKPRLIVIGEDPQKHVYGKSRLSPIVFRENKIMSV
jgi:hypothetical protein